VIASLRARLTRSGVKRHDPPLPRPPYADRHPGSTALVLGNGPSLARERDALERLIEAEALLVLGANHITPFRHPDYHAFTNRKRFIRYAETIDSGRSRVLLSPYFAPRLIRQHYRGLYEELAYVADNEAPFAIDDGIIQTSCRTVTPLLIGVAIVMGARTIRVAGLDGFPEVLEQGDPALGASYHEETQLLKRELAQYHEIDRYTRRFLAEIQDWLAGAGREAFAIVTPTTYDEHHRPEILARHR